MNDERRAGVALSRFAFGLGAKKPKPTPKPAADVGQLLTPEQPGSGVTSGRSLARQGLGGCSCTKRKVK